MFLKDSQRFLVDVSSIAEGFSFDSAEFLFGAAFRFMISPQDGTISDHPEWLGRMGEGRGVRKCLMFANLKWLALGGTDGE